MTKLGHITNFDFSQIATQNINKLLKLVKSRLSSTGKTKSQDPYGNVVYIDTDIFADEMLIDFLVLSLSDFNQTPYFTFFTFEHTKLIDTFADVLVEGAVLQALASKALIEKGREFQIKDDGVYLNPPNVSDMLMTQFNSLLRHHYDKLKLIKSDSTIQKF